MFNIFKRKRKKEITIEYIENKYKIKLSYPIIDLSKVNTGDNFYNELINFGCYDIITKKGLIHKDCLKSAKYQIDLVTGKIVKKSDGECKNCNFYPIVKNYEDSLNIKKVRYKKLNKIRNLFT